MPGRVPVLSAWTTLIYMPGVTIRLLIICTSRIGDVFLGSSVIESLRKRDPKLLIDFLVFKGTEAVIERNPHVNQIIQIDRKISFLTHLKMLFRVRRKYDVAVSLLSGDRPTLYSLIAGRVSFGIVGEELKYFWKRWLLSGYITPSKSPIHTIIQNHKILEQYLETELCPPKFYWDKKDEDSIDKIIDADDSYRGYAVFHLTPKYTYKEWPLSKWMRLANKLRERGLKVILVGLPEVIHAVSKPYTSDNWPTDTLDLLGKISLSEVGYLISRATIYVGTDTAVTHMAAAIGTPAVALFGPSSPIIWGPWPKNYRSNRNPWSLKGTQVVGNVGLVQNSFRGCVPCMEEGCERHLRSHSDCLRYLSAEEVLSSIDDQLQP